LALLFWLYRLSIRSISSRRFKLNTMSARPITGFLPWYTQLAFSFHLCAYVYSGMTVLHGYVAMLCVGIGLTRDLDLWPPMFDQPYYSPNLTQFWSRNWHMMYRRTFLRLSSPFMPAQPLLLELEAVNEETAKIELESPPPEILRPKRKRRTMWERSMVIVLAFAFSALLHGIVYARVPADANHPHTSLIETRLMLFFLAQPIGIIVDRFLGKTIGNSWTGRAVRRIFAWTWLLWTVRWWADDYAKKGLWDHKKPSV